MQMKQEGMGKNNAAVSIAHVLRTMIITDRNGTIVDITQVSLTSNIHVIMPLKPLQKPDSLNDINL